MKCMFNEEKRLMVLDIDPQEKEKIKDYFPVEYLKSSKVVKVRNCMDKYGNPTGETFIEIKGATKK